MGKYDDIIDLPHYRSPNRTAMPIENRAAQFAPFAALSGHNEAISETSRLTELKRQLTEEEKHSLSKSLAIAVARSLPVSVIYFKSDKLKKGGSYVEITGVITKIDDFDKTLTFASNGVIPLEDILSVSFAPHK